jgi:glycosyltransferase involved in cell wall biosynthesis
MSFVEQLAYMPRKLYSREAAKKLNELLESFKPDIAHLHLYKGGLTASILPVLKRKGVPAVITLHDYSLLCPRNTFIDGDGNICENCLTKTKLNCVYKRCNRKNIYYSTINYLEFILNNAILKPEHYFHKIICVSKFNYNKHSSYPFFRDRFVQLYNFFPDLCNSQPNGKTGNYFLFYGRLVAEKGVMTLINTWKRLPGDYYLKIIGGGIMSDRIVAEIKENNLTNIEFVGFRKGDELFNYIRHASFVLVPSEWYENNPLTIVEAYSVGKPVIGSDIGGIPELVREGETGFLFKMGDSGEFEEKIRKAASMNEKQYRQMSEAVYSFASELFSEKRHYQALLNIYMELINTKRS